MPSFQCGVCGDHHQGILRDIGYRRPREYFDVPELERERRVRCSDDLCSIDGKLFLVRGVLYLPIVGTDEQFGWGVWARVSRHDFQRYVRAWKEDTEDETPPFPGQLSGGLPPYPGSGAMELSVKLRSGGQRPLFTACAEEYQLTIDQRTGITPEQAHSFVAEYL
jgi:hypothetical protein